MKLAAIYARVSTRQQQEEATIESQKEILLKYSKDQGYQVPVGWLFEDNGVSGASLVRPALDKLRDFASEGLFNTLFILSPDRLSRKYAYQVILLEELKKNGVQVYFKSGGENSNTPEEALLRQMQSMFAEYERAQIAERSRRGKIYKAKHGFVSVLSNAPYGYRYISSKNGMLAYFEIVEKEASIVRMIFDLYVKNQFPMMKIARALQQQQIPSPKGSAEWSKSSIGNLLKNSTYQGIAHYGIRETTEPLLDRLPGRRNRFNGRKKPPKGIKIRQPNDWIPIKVPAIISEEIFALAQEIRNKNKKMSSRNTKKGTLLQGLLSCKVCGYAFILRRSGKISNRHEYYRCSSSKTCGNRGIRVEQLDLAIWKCLMTTLESPELIQKEISRRLLELKSDSINERNKQLNKQLVKMDDESNRLLDAYQNGCIELKELKNRMCNLKKEMNNIRREITKENLGLNATQLLELNEAVKFFSVHLRESKNNLSLDEKKKLMKMLVREIQIGKEDITVDHILPIDENGNVQNAHLRTDCKGACD